MKNHPKSLSFNMKCYYCLCDVCNLVKCPYKPKDKASICYKRCYLKGFEKRPLLQCDFFVHKQKTKMYKVKLHNRKLYTEKDVADMFQQILEKIERSDSDEKS